MSAPANDPRMVVLRQEYRAAQPQFCPLCDVTLDLHDGPDTCALAQSKAALLERFESMFGGH